MRRCLRHTVLLLAATVTLSACQPNRFFSAWLPWWAGTSAITPLGTDAASLYSELSPSSFGTDANTAVHLVGSCTKLRAATAAARTAGVPVIVTVFDSTAAKVMAGIVKNSTTRGQHVQHLVDLVMQGGVGTCTGAAFDGVDRRFTSTKGASRQKQTPPRGYPPKSLDGTHSTARTLFCANDPGF